MHISFFLCLCIALLLTQCRPVEPNPEVKVNEPSVQPISINVNFPFGYEELGNIGDSIFWEIDPYADQDETADQTAFDALQNVFYKLNGIKAMKQRPELNKITPLLLSSRQFGNELFDTAEFFRTDSLLYRLPDAGRYHCYYYHASVNNPYSKYGNLMLTDTVSGASWVINIYHEVAGEQHLKLRYFEFSRDRLLLMDGSLYDDGCRLRKSWNAVFDEKGRLIIKKYDPDR